MAGRPRARARREAELISKGVEPAAPVDNRPMRKPPNRERGWDLYKERGQATAVPAEAPAPRAPPQMDEGELGSLVNALSNGESNHRFATLQEKAFAFAEEIMDLPLDPDSKNFIKVLSVKQAITTAMLTATTRVRPGDFRDKEDDGVGQLLDEIKRQSGEAAETAEERDARLRREMLD